MWAFLQHDKNKTLLWALWLEEHPTFLIMFANVLLD